MINLQSFGLWSFFVGFTAIFVSACQTTDLVSAYDDSRVDAVTWDQLEKFDSNREFKSYLREVKTLARRRGDWWAQSQYVQLAQNSECVDPEDCLLNDEIVVTGSRVKAAPVSVNITNVQSAGVDEGDIVKQIGDYLVVLQDGRLFSVHMGGPSSKLEYKDRIDVYSDPNSDTWYDEILVSDNLVLVTGYSYDQEATEFNLIALDDNGRFEAKARYYISSDDYFDSDNYATRIIGNKLIIYTPLDLTGYDSWNDLEWPIIRRWVDEQDWNEKTVKLLKGTKQHADEYPKERLETILAGRHLFSARDIHKPIQRTTNPFIHSVSVCSIEVKPDMKPLDCRTTAFIGPAGQEFYVSGEDVFLWLGPGWDDFSDDIPDCKPDYRVTYNEAYPSTLFKINVDSGRPTALFLRGGPNDQFSMEAGVKKFHAVFNMTPSDCDDDSAGHKKLVLYSFPYSRFSSTPREIRAADYFAIPTAVPNVLENRITNTHAVIGGRDRWSSYPPGIFKGTPETAISELTFVPLADPERFWTEDLPHNVIRMERVIDDIVVTGYHDKSGLQLTYLKPDAGPGIVDTITLKGRYESEGRSHAFNYTVTDDDEFLLGIPTVAYNFDTARWWSRSGESDVSFLKIDGSDEFTSLGLLTSSNDVDPSYRCEVSCIDWYGNSRPIFTNGRVFALLSTEIAEGRLSNERIIELDRINLTRPVLTDQPIRDALRTEDILD